MFARARRFAGIDSAHIATIVVVLLAYVVSLIGYLWNRNTPEGPPYSATALVVAAALSAVTLALYVKGYTLLGGVFKRYAKAVNFALLILLVLTIEFLLRGSNGIWLISMPLVALAATDLPPLWRWPVYLAVLVGMAAPIYIANDSLSVALFALLSFSPAVVFVIVFVRLTQQAEIAQVKAESLAAQLAEANTRLSAFAVQAEELATTKERNRLAREIHDNLGHFLTVANVQIKAAQAVMDKDPERARGALDHAARLTQEGLTAVRHSVAALRESPLAGVPLPEALAALAAETQAAGIVTQLTVTGAPRPLDSRAELTLYRAAQEGLTNVRKHARASRVDVALAYDDPAAVSLTVRDNGVGRRAGSIQEGGHNEVEPGFGLLGLGERARQLGGHLLTEDLADGGYQLTLRLPSPVPAAQTEGELMI